MCLVADWVIIETPVTLIGVHTLGSGAGIIASIVVVQARIRRDPPLDSPRSTDKFAEIHVADLLRPDRRPVVEGRDTLGDLVAAVRVRAYVRI